MKTTHSVNTPNIATEVMNTGLRPTRSASQPPSCGAQHHADVADGEHPLHFAGAESELRCEPRSGYAHGLDIEALEHGDCHAQRNWNGNLHYEPPMGSNGSPT